MKLYLVTGRDYDFALIDSVWPTQEEAQARIAFLQSFNDNDEGYEFQSWSLKITEMTMSVPRVGFDRFEL